MSIRDKRLHNDYEKITGMFREGGKITVKNISGNPPEKYQIEFKVNSLVMQPNGNVQVKNSHIAEIYLTNSYPRQAPQCRMLTPVFHPNIAPHAICIGDHWSAGESLSHLIVRIAEMLAFQSYNLKSPLNGDAAKWTHVNFHRFPIDNTDFSSYYDISDNIIAKDVGNANQSFSCVGCEKSISGSEVILCSSKHPVCSDCVIKCGDCQRILCKKCISSKCSICSKTLCAHCHQNCVFCQANVCQEHSKKCNICGKVGCDDCSAECYLCKSIVCIDHMRKIPNSNFYCCVNCEAKI